MAQKTNVFLETKLTDSIALNADEFIGVDKFDNIYYLKNDIFYKKNDKKTLSYTNTQLGKISSVDIKNPLKIILFYSDFNTVILLDSKLNELTDKIDFRSTSLSKNIALVEGSSNNNLWMYSLDDNTLQLYNYKTEQLLFTSQSLSFGQSVFKAKKLVSSYKNCWLIGEKNVLQFSEYGTFLNQIEIAEVTDIKLLSASFIFLKDDDLYRYKNRQVESINLKKQISINSFYVNKNEIYIFDGSTVFVFSFTEK